MIEQIVENFVVVGAEARLSEVRAISGGKYVVIVDQKEAPVALATREDVVALRKLDEKPLVEVVSHLPPTLIAGRGIAIENLVKAAQANPNLLARGTVLLDAEGVAGVHPVKDLIGYLRSQGSGYSTTIAKLQTASLRVGSSSRTWGLPSGRIGTSGRPWTLPGKKGRPCIPVACSVCGHLNCLKYIPLKGGLMPMCENPKPPPHRFEMRR